MRVFRLTKKNGKFRTIYAPSKEEKKALQALLPSLLTICKMRCPPDVVHGFMPGRSPITNAACHVGFAYTISFDLKDFFDTVTWRQLNGVLPEPLLSQVLYDGAARQGLPTSPLVANIAAAAMDWHILQTTLPHGIVYTRYADDLTFSTQFRPHIDMLKEVIPTIATTYHFTINPDKTHVQFARAGRRVVTGVAVDDARLYATRKVRRKLRAARHQRHRASASGLAEWIKLKPPVATVNSLMVQRQSIAKMLNVLQSQQAAIAETQHCRSHRAFDL